MLLLQVQRSQSIVVVGGGSAGVEMAAEIKTEYPDKEVGRWPWLGALSLSGHFFLCCVRKIGICSGPGRRSSLNIMWEPVLPISCSLH